MESQSYNDSQYYFKEYDMTHPKHEYKHPNTVKFKKTHPDAKLPEYAHSSDTGMDIHSVEDVVVPVGKVTMVRTGLSCELPLNTEFQFRSKSGLAAKHGVFILN